MDTNGDLHYSSRYPREKQLLPFGWSLFGLQRSECCEEEKGLSHCRERNLIFRSYSPFPARGFSSIITFYTGEAET